MRTLRGRRQNFVKTVIVDVGHMRLGQILQHSDVCYAMASCAYPFKERVVKVHPFTVLDMARI